MSADNGAYALAFRSAGLGKHQLLEMGAAARLRFEDLFTDRKMYEATNAIYQRVLPSLGVYRSWVVDRSEPSPVLPELRPLDEARADRARVRSA